MCRYLISVTILMAIFVTQVFSFGVQEEPTPANDPVGNDWTEGMDLVDERVSIAHGLGSYEAEVFRESLERFVNITGIQLDVEEWDDFDDELASRTEDDDLPDFVLISRLPVLNDLFEAGQTQDIHEWISPQDLRDRYVAEAWVDTVTVDDELAGLWYGVTETPSLLWLPQDHADEYHDASPGSWGELMEYSDRLVEEGVTPWSMAFESGEESGWPAADWLEERFFAMHGSDAYEQFITGDIPLDSDEVREALQPLLDITREPDKMPAGSAPGTMIPFTDGLNPLMGDEPLAGFHRQSSDVAFAVDDIESFGSGGDLTVEPVPPHVPGRNTAIVSGLIAVPTSERPEVRALARYFTGAESLDDWFRSGGIVSPHEDAVPANAPSLERQMTNMLSDTDDIHVRASDFWRESGADLTKLYAGMMDILEGDSPDEVLPAIEEAMWE